MQTNKRSIFRARHLSSAVVVLSALVLTLGWGRGMDLLIRFPTHAPAIVPGTALCIALIGAASILPRWGITRHIGRAVLVAVLAYILAASLPFSPSAQWIHGWLFYAPTPSDGFSGATRLALILALIAPAIRFGLLRLDRDWQVHVPLFGMLMALFATLSLAIDPNLLGHLALFERLSLFTSILLTLLFAAQLAQHSEDSPIDQID